MGELDALFTQFIQASKAVAQKVDPARVQRFIEAQEDVAGPVRLSNVRGSESNVGSSSGILVFTAEYNDVRTGPIARDLVLRYDPQSENRLFLKYDLAEQFRLQKALQGSGIPVAKPYWLDATGEDIGMPGFIMERIEGICPNQSAFTSGLLAQASPEDRAAMLDDLMRTMAALHNIDWAARGLSDLMMDAEGATPVARIINMRWKTWEWIGTPEFERLAPVRKWLLENEPETRVVLTHGDSSLGNYMFRDNKVVAVLDWELSSLGAAELDIGIQLIANDLKKHFSGEDVPAMPSDSQWIDLYEKHSGRPIVDIDYFKRLGRYLSSVTLASQNRNLPGDIKSSQRKMSDYLWTKIED